MLTVYHLGISQSERIPWLCEELGIAYELKRFDRQPNRLAPPIFSALHAIGSAPIITDGDLVLAESGAIMEYLMTKYGDGRLRVGPDDPHYADYLYWFHATNATLMANQACEIVLKQAGGKDQNPAFMDVIKARADRPFALAEAQLGRMPYFGGQAFSAADIMMFYPLTTSRRGNKRDIGQSPNTRAYLKRVGSRPAYLRAMSASEPGMTPNLD